MNTGTRIKTTTPSAFTSPAKPIGFLFSSIPKIPYQNTPVCSDFQILTRTPMIVRISALGLLIGGCPCPTKLNMIFSLLINIKTTTIASIFILITGEIFMLIYL